MGPSDEKHVLCPVQSLRYYLEKIEGVSLQPRTIVSPNKPTRLISKYA